MIDKIISGLINPSKGEIYFQNLPFLDFKNNIDNYSLDQIVNDSIDIVGISRTSIKRFPHEFSGG
jgi:ABC-type transporter Mla maintaining outer membrane lipid asymmetry ATPase subunit MlaF